MDLNNPTKRRPTRLHKQEINKDGQKANFVDLKDLKHHDMMFFFLFWRIIIFIKSTYDMYSGIQKHQQAKKFVASTKTTSNSNSLVFPNDLLVFFNP